MEGRRGDLFNEVHHYIRSMSKLSARLVGVVTALVALAGVAFGVQAATAVSRTTLKITRTTFCTAENTTCDEPKGHVLQFSGWFDMRLLVTQADGLHNTKLMPLVQGKDVGRTGFYFAGVQDDLVFVRKGSTLQVQRETRDEQSTVANAREPIFTMYLPASIKLEIAK